MRQLTYLVVISLLPLPSPVEAQALPNVSSRSADYLSLLPDGAAKRRFILDCTGCHQFDARIAFAELNARPEEDWRLRTSQMLGFAGASTVFPIISADRNAGETAQWLAKYVRELPVATDEPLEGAPRDSYVLDEFPVPVPEDLPHDVAVDRDGRLLITGMFTHVVWRLDPATGEFRDHAIPLSNANPRAIELDDHGDWWILLGNPQLMVRYRPDDGEWDEFDIGVYPHSLRSDARGRVWFNGHFTKDPELIGYVDASDGSIRTIEVPTTNALREGGGPIPYGLRVAPNGMVWMTELQGNRLIGFDPKTDSFTAVAFPTPHSGPRRLDVGADGVVWIPEYANNRLARYDPATGQLTEYELPTRDALPYVVRIDHQRERIWIGTGAADALLLFDPAEERFTAYPLPSPGALIRHLAIDPVSGAVWAPYGASPGVPARIVRLRVH
jgi:streptogramin lyase